MLTQSAAETIIKTQIFECDPYEESSRVLMISNQRNYIVKMMSVWKFLFFCTKSTLTSMKLTKRQTQFK